MSPDDLNIRDFEITFSTEIKVDAETYACWLWGCPRSDVALDDLPLADEPS